MSMRPIVALVALLFVSSSPACKKDTGGLATTDVAVAPPAVAAVPTKADVITLLRTVDDRLSERKFEGMEDLFGVPQGFSAEQLGEHLSVLQERGELSASGIDALEARGRFGRAADVVGPDRAQRFAEKFGVRAEACVALGLDEAEVVLCLFPDGKRRIVRLDDVGRLR